MARKFIVLTVETSTGPTEYRINTDSIRLYWVHSTPGKVNISLAGSGASHGSTVVAQIEIGQLDSLVGL